jgi:hypothetical protein
MDEEAFDSAEVIAEERSIISRLPTDNRCIETEFYERYLFEHDQNSSRYQDGSVKVSDIYLAGLMWSICD